jgi:hypothetical protein
MTAKEGRNRKERSMRQSALTTLLEYVASACDHGGQVTYFGCSFSAAELMQ